MPRPRRKPPAPAPEPPSDLEGGASHEELEELLLRAAAWAAMGQASKSAAAGLVYPESWPVADETIWASDDE